MSASKIRAGQAYVEVGVIDKVDAGLKAVGMKLQRFGRGLAFLGTGAMALGGSVLGMLTPAIQEASNYQETLNKFNQVFGDQAEAARGFAKDLADSIGRDVGDVMQAMAASQSMFRGLDFEPEKAREMSQQLAALALDFASFHNITDEDAFQRFQQALSGSAEVLDTFGINTKEVALKEKMLEMGAKRVNGQFDEQAKILARVAIIQEAMQQQGAIGDAFRTKGSLANQLKAIESQWTRLKRAMGTPLIPIVVPALKVAFDLLKRGAEILENSPQIATTIFGLALATVGLGIAMTGAGGAIIFVGLVLAGLVPIITFVTGAFATMWGVVFSPIAAGAIAIAALAVSLALIGRWLVQNTALGRAFAVGFGSGVTALGSAFMKVWGGILDALMSGDLGLAADIAGKAFKVAWMSAFDFLQGAFLDVKNGMLSAWDTLTIEMQATWTAFAKVVGNQFLNMLQKLVDFSNGFLKVLTLQIRQATGQEIKFGRIDDSFIGKGRESLQDLGFDKQIAEAEAALQKAIREAEASRLNGIRDDAIGRAEAERNALIEKAKLQRAGLELPDWATFMEQFQGAKNMEATGGAGTFSAAGARLLGRTDRTQEEIAEATKGSLKALEKIDQHLLESRLEFIA